MASSTSSNLWGNKNIQDISNSGARLIMSHPISGFSGGISTAVTDDDGSWVYGRDGVTAGDVIRYDVVAQKSDGTANPSYNMFTKAQGDLSSNAEVVGVIETIENNVANVVLSGQIKFPTARFATADYEPVGAVGSAGGASGGNDVYFLSAATAGGIQNLAPNIGGQIAKPVLQFVGDGVFNAHVVNYIGYQIGGNVAGSVETYNATGQANWFPDFTGNLVVDGKNGWFNVSEKTQLPLSKEHWTYVDRLYTNAGANIFGHRFGMEHDIVLDSTPPTSLLGETIIQKDGRNTIWKGEVIGRNASENKITVQSTTLDSNNIAIEPVTDKTFYRGQVTYTGTSVTPMAFSLPVYKPTNNQTFSDIYGKESTHSSVYGMYVEGDGNQSSIIIPESATINKLVVTDSIAIKSSDQSVTVNDLAYVIKQLTDGQKTINDTLNKTTASFDVT